MNQSNHEKLARMINDIQFAMLTTVDSAARMHSRPMVTMAVAPETFDGTLWFFSREDSLKNHDIKNGSDILLTYAHPDSHKYVSVSGVASVEKNKTKMNELWSSKLETWFPDGLKDPHLSLIKVDVESADLWDSHLGGKLTRLIEKAKSIVTGKSYNGPAVQGQHLDINIH